MSKKLLLLFLTIAALFSFASCTNQAIAPTAEPTEVITAEPTDEPTEEPPEEIVVSQPLDEAILKIMEDRLTAIENEDSDLYMSAIGLNNQFFYCEQETWFSSMIDADITNLSFEIISTEMVDETTGVVTIHQIHSNGDEDFDFEYPLLFKYEDDQWFDYGYNFNTIETDKYLVKYMDGETRVEEFEKYLNDAFEHLDELYDLKPVENYELKLFNDIEMLRQRAIPGSPWVFTACADFDESIRIFTDRPDDYTGYDGVVQHELVHHITIRMCNQNLTVWLLEGIAMYDGNAYYGFDTIVMFADLNKEGVSHTIEYLDENNMYTTDLTTQEVFNYYGTSYMYIKYIVETYGREALMNIFYEAGKNPPYETSIIDDEFNEHTMAITSDVILTVLGVTTEQLSNDYLEWLDGVDLENIQ